MDDKAKIAALEARIARMEQERVECTNVAEALRASEHHFSSLLETIPYGIQECTVEGIITFSNRAHHQLCECDPGELIGKPIWELLEDPAEKERMPGLLRQLATEQPPPSPFLSRNRTKGGRVVDVRVDWNYKRDARECVIGFTSVITDITEQLKASRALEESEQRYRTLFQKAGDALFLLEAEGQEAGRIIDANQAAVRMHGFSLDELKHMKIQEIDGPQDATHVANRIRRMLDGQWVHEEILHRKKDGALFPVELSAGIISLGKKKVVLGIDRDITEQTAAKSALKEQIDFLQTLIDNLPHPIFYKDAQGVYLGCNKAFEAFTGSKKETLVGKTVFEVSPQDLAQKYYDADQQLFASRSPQTYEAWVRNATGEYRSVIFNKAVFYHKDGCLGGLVGAILDITDRKRAEEENALLAAAIEQTPEMIIMTDRKGVIHYVNPAFEQISGYGRHEAIGRTPALLQKEGPKSASNHDLWSSLETRNSWKGRLTNRRKDGSLFEVEATIAPVHRQGGEIAGFLAVERDISQQIFQEKQLRQAQKMEAIGTLAGGIAHDFNNILSAILGFTEIALHDMPETNAQRPYLKKVLQAGERARRLVHQILTFSRATEQENRPVEVRFIVKEALKLMQATLPSTIAIECDCASSAAILADPTQIHQVVMNLCTNAAHAMRETGGRLTVSLTDGAAVTGADRNLPGNPRERQVKLCVQDTGTGMAPEVVERIFDPFFTTKKPGEGTGMGLSVVHGIVKSCKGTIRVRSTPGQGSTFTVVLPVIENPAPTAEPAETALPLGSERILFVDDEPFQVDLAENMLQRLGYRVTAVNSSARALTLFKAAPERYDLVVTDMTMPDMTGDRLAQELLKIRPELPVIVCTGYSHRLTETSALELGLAGIALKPLIMKDLAVMIRRAIDKVLN
jgi:PAS domain S-box-containing protein